MFAYALNITIISKNHQLMCTLQFQAIMVRLNTPKGVPNAKLKSNGNIKSFLVGNMSDNCLPTRTLLHVSFIQIFNSLNRYVEIQDAMRILQESSLLIE